MPSRASAGMAEVTPDKSATRAEVNFILYMSRWLILSVCLSWVVEGNDLQAGMPVRASPSYTKSRTPLTPIFDS